MKLPTLCMLPAVLTAALSSVASLGAEEQAQGTAPHGINDSAPAVSLPALDRIVFIKRHDSAGVFHMCDQYYGCNAVPGGGIFVLNDPFSANPRLENLLAGSVVQIGRLQGTTLTGGSFLSLELSFDGKTLLFAYSEAKAWEKHRGEQAYEWSPECSYHIFKCNADGSGLVQLTDGPWNDFDPCFLPDGRIVFVSERRGGYLRCGRQCPVYTLHSMSADGSNIVRLSSHETHEWHPSVTNDGRIVYTRWDYIDRDTNIAHHIWTCYPDGRDPQSPHGNYPDRRESRPWMEMSIRAVPNSHKFVAVTGAHHGHAFGSLVLIDPHLPDDRAGSQLTLLTPDVPFAESSGKDTIRHCMVYGTPWPLSEDEYLCAYDPEGVKHGIYWIDRFGHRKLIYEDPSYACVDPIPLAPRPAPPVITRTTASPPQPIAADHPPSEPAKAATAGPAHRHQHAPSATVTVINAYDSQESWPEGTRLTTLRIIQVLPKTTAPPNEPRIGVAQQTNARAVLGTVPIEKDGSAHFEVPAGKEVYFQVLDELGMAVQSMRSGTYFQPGEKMQCQGCHARTSQAPRIAAQMPLALRRPPSRIEPEAEGANPFNYVRLVQPVLDRHCTGCHQEGDPIDLTGVPEADAYGWTRSYCQLAEKYGFYFHVYNGSIDSGAHGGSRTVPGKFGARATALLDCLGPQHYGVQLPAEDLRRVTLWLDCNSEFYGAYEDAESQARGKTIWPTLE